MVRVREYMGNECAVLLSCRYLGTHLWPLAEVRLEAKLTSHSLTHNLQCVLLEVLVLFWNRQQAVEVCSAS